MPTTSHYCSRFIQQLNSTIHFMLVTNLVPCSGIEIHLRPEKGHLDSEIEHADRRAFEVTTKTVQIPTGPAPRQASSSLCLTTFWILMFNLRELVNWVLLISSV